MKVFRSRGAIGACRAGCLAAASLAGAALTAPAFGQFMFQRHVEAGVSERAYSIEQTFDDGGYVTAGARTMTSGFSDIFVCRYKPDGSPAWDTIIGGPGRDVGYCIRQTSDGGFIVAAETDSLGTTVGIALVRLSPAGVLLWARVYGGTPFVGGRIGVAVRETPDGGFAVVGRHRSAAGGGQGGTLLRTDSAGGIVFNRRYNNPAFGASDFMSFADLRVESDGFAIVGHDAVSGTAPYDMLICKIGPAGAPMWAMVHGEPAFTEEPDSIERLTGGGYAFTAWDSSIPAPGGTRFVQTTPAGTQVVSRRYSGFRSAQSALRENNNLNLVMGGSATFAGGITAASMVLTTPDGAPMTSVAYGGFLPNFVDEGEAAIPTSDCGYALAGRTDSFPVIPSDKYLVKTNKCLLSGCNEVEYALPEEKRAVPEHPINLTSVTLSGTFWQPTVTSGSTNRVLCLGPLCVADYNCDGFVTGEDFDEFVEAFVNGVIQADINCDNFVTGEDFDTFVDAFIAGC